MGDIKSAREIAMEKVAELGEVTEEERLKWRYTPEGEKLAGIYLREEHNLTAALDKYEEKARKYVAASASTVLVSNINLPKDDAVRKGNKRVMDGLKVLKTDKVGVENVYSKMRQLFNHYTEQGEQQKQQAYQQLKVEFEAKIQQAMQQQMGLPMGANIDVERQPQFQEEWRRVQLQLDSQYNTLLGEYKQELLDIV